jgi:hypothetical protein
MRRRCEISEGDGGEWKGEGDIVVGECVLQY